MTSRVRNLLLAAALGGASLAGCASNDNATADRDRDANISVSVSNKTIMAGETVTFTTSSRNTLGRDPSVKWTSTGGKIKTDEDGRIARVTFDKPGTYTVTSRLYLGNKLVDDESVDIRVEPVK